MSKFEQQPLTAEQGLGLSREEALNHIDEFGIRYIVSINPKFSTDISFLQEVAEMHRIKIMYFSHSSRTFDYVEQNFFSDDAIRALAPRNPEVLQYASAKLQTDLEFIIPFITNEKSSFSSAQYVMKYEINNTFIKILSSILLNIQITMSGEPQSWSKLFDTLFKKKSPQLEKLLNECQFDALKALTKNSTAQEVSDSFKLVVSCLEKYKDF